MSGDRRDFLLEIGCEEIPARMIGGAVSDLAERMIGILDAAGLAHGESRTFSSPRRLAVVVRDVAPRQDDREEEVLGPPAKAALAPDGTPTKAAAGFAQKMGVRPEDLLKVPTPKGDYLGVRRTVAGRAAGVVVAEGLPRSVSAMSFPKMMRWGDGTRRFVRPVHWVVALYGSEIVPLELFGVRSGRDSRGHRVLGSGSVSIASTSDYEPALLAQGVVVDRAVRKEALARKLTEIAARERVRPVDDEELLEEVADLVEHPGAVLGSFPPEFLSLPREVLVTTLRHHQKAFSAEPIDRGGDGVESRSGASSRGAEAGLPVPTEERGPGDARSGALSRHFLVVADHDKDPEGHIRKGSEWVVVGRLEDARFFFEEDRKTPIAERFEKLAHVTFHAKAGSYADKSRRVEAIAAALAAAVNEARSSAQGGSGDGTAGVRSADQDGSHGERAPARPKGGGTGAIDVAVVREAARLAKCDLVTGLVGEFPELQGIAGALFLRAEDGVGRAAAVSASSSSSSAASSRGEEPQRTNPPAPPRGVAMAIYDQYKPAGANDSLPRSPEGAILALADRLDTVGALARTIGLPTGSRDPYGLRRAAGGAIRIVAETPLPLSLRRLWEVTCSVLDSVNIRQVSGDGAAGAADGSPDAPWYEFLRERLQHWLKTEGAEYDSANAVMLAANGERAGIDTIPRLAEKVLALQRMREMPDLAALVEVHKRCRNILEQAEAGDGAGKTPSTVKEDPGEAAAFSALVDAVGGAEPAVKSAMQNDDFEPGLQHLVRLRPVLSRFFDHVLVMHPEPSVRRQRLELVRRIAVMIEEVADLKQLAISRDERKALRET